MPKPTEEQDVKATIAEELKRQQLAAQLLRESGAMEGVASYGAAQLPARGAPPLRDAYVARYGNQITDDEIKRMRDMGVTPGTGAGYAYLEKTTGPRSYSGGMSLLKNLMRGKNWNEY